MLNASIAFILLASIMIAPHVTETTAKVCTVLFIVVAVLFLVADIATWRCP